VQAIPCTENGRLTPQLAPPVGGNRTGRDVLGTRRSRRHGAHSGKAAQVDEAAWPPRCFQACVDQMSSSLTIDMKKLPRRAGPRQSGHMVDLIHSMHGLQESARVVHGPLGNRHRRKPRDPSEPSDVPDKTANLMPLGEQRLHQVTPDETCPSGHQNPHATSLYKRLFIDPVGLRPPRAQSFQYGIGRRIALE
jgi:hypothetical protein